MDHEPQDFRAKLRQGRFLAGVEIDPPRGLAMAGFLSAARQARDAGADFVNVGDSPMAEVRMSATAAATILKTQLGLSPIVHVSARDRNLMALQADLLGAHALGLRDVLCIKGDPHSLGRHRKATPVWDVNALGLLRLIRGFNQGFDPLEEPLDQPTDFLAAATINPAAADLAAEVRLARRKAEAGAAFYVSQAVFDIDALRRLIGRLPPDHPPIIVGLWPLHSARQAEFLNSRIVPVPESIRRRMAAAGAEARQCGQEIAAELLEQLPQLVQGVYFIPSFGRMKGIDALLRRARELALAPASR